jgi:hypothetical protein
MEFAGKWWRIVWTLIGGDKQIKKINVSDHLDIRHQTSTHQDSGQIIRKRRHHPQTPTSQNILIINHFNCVH